MIEAMRMGAVAALVLGMLAGCTRVTLLDGGVVTGSTWYLIELNGTRTGVAANGQRPSLVLGADGRAGGNAGCNHYGGEYTLRGEVLTFSALGMTRMYCEGFMDLETRFGSALQETRSWRLQGSTLELLNDSRVLARFMRG